MKHYITTPEGKVAITVNQLQMATFGQLDAWIRQGLMVWWGGKENLVSSTRGCGGIPCLHFVGGSYAGVWQLKD